MRLQNVKSTPVATQLPACRGSRLHRDLLHPKIKSSSSQSTFHDCRRLRELQVENIVPAAIFHSGARTLFHPFTGAPNYIMKEPIVYWNYENILLPLMCISGLSFMSFAETGLSSLCKLCTVACICLSALKCILLDRVQQKELIFNVFKTREKDTLTNNSVVSI